jgi:parvulin-like peptidyl-prolyl isomerase
MARRVEEEESYWPGFVDALSTIVMVVTFLLIILGVAIFAISTQVSKVVIDNEAATATAKAKIAESQEQLREQRQQAQAALQTGAKAREAAEQATAQLEAIKQSDRTETNRLAAQLAEQQTESQRMAFELQVASQAMTEQAKQLAAQQQATQELQQRAQQAQNEAEQVATELEQTRAALESKEQEVTQLSETVATLNEATAAQVLQEQAVEADNVMRISSTAVTIDPKEIEVAPTEIDERAGEVEVTSAHEVLTVRFQAGAIDLNKDAAAEAEAFVQLNRDTLGQHIISLWSFYDGTSLSVTQAKRTAYFRLLAVRNVLLDAGFDAASIDISVRTAEQPADIHTVKTFLRTSGPGAVQ